MPAPWPDPTGPSSVMNGASLTSPTEALSFAEVLSAFARTVDGELAACLAEKRGATAPGATPLVDAVRALIESGGKRLRPALIHHTFLACGGEDPAGIRPLALASELLHAYLLIHDDIMDHAEVRRGQPTAHARFRELHRQRGWRGDGDDYGRSMGILAGDLAASYAFELFALTRTRLAAAWPRVEACFAAMAQEVIHGQFLEIDLSFTEDDPGAEELLRVLRLKSGLYSVERPVELGALAAGAGAEALDPLRRYGAALGEVFQLRDDLLGMFGEAGTVGKSVGGDLVEGKLTFLIHHAMQASSPQDRAFLGAVRGRGELTADEIRRTLDILRTSGARERVEAMITERLAIARQSLAALPAASGTEARAGRAFLAGLIDYSRQRQR